MVLPPTDERFHRLADAADALAGELELDALLEVIVATASAVTGARYAALGILGDDEEIARFVTHGVTPQQIEEIGHYPTGKGILGLLIRDPRVIRLDDLSSHPASAGFPPNHPPMTNFLGAPILSSGRVYGNLYLTEKPGGFGEEDEHLLMVLAAQAGAAVENALLSERLQLLAVQDERDRISRELHDGVIQSLFSIGMGLESARALVERDPQRVLERFDAAVDAIDATIRELRNYIFHLRPNQAAAFGLERGLAELAREYEVNALVRPHVRVPPSLDALVPDTLVPDLLQIVREALSNAAKHALASAVEITLTLSAGTLSLEVADDGVGFIVPGPAVGRGLENMQERADTMGGSLDVDSTLGEGTTIRVTVPIREGAL